MKKITLVLICIMCVLIGKAQKVELSVYGGLASTSLRNANDLKELDSLLVCKSVMKPSMGVDLGFSYKIKNLKMKLSVGYGLQYIEEKYTATNIKKDLEANTKMSYSRIPIIVQFSFTKLGKFEPFVSFGYYMGSLIKYTQKEYTIDKSSSLIIERNLEFDNKNFSLVVDTTDINNGVKAEERRSETVYDHGLYVKKDNGIILNGGTSYKISEKTRIFIQLNYTKGLNDVEYKGKQNFTGIMYKDNIQYNIVGNDIELYKALRSKFTHDYFAPERAVTKTQTLGLQLGLNYTF